MHYLAIIYSFAFRDPQADNAVHFTWLFLPPNPPISTRVPTELMNNSGPAAGACSIAVLSIVELCGTAAVALLS